MDTTHYKLCNVLLRLQTKNISKMVGFVKKKNLLREV